MSLKRDLPIFSGLEEVESHAVDLQVSDQERVVFTLEDADEGGHVFVLPSMTRRPRYLRIIANIYLKDRESAPRVQHIGYVVNEIFHPYVLERPDAESRANAAFFLGLLISVVASCLIALLISFLHS